MRRGAIDAAVLTVALLGAVAAPARLAAQQPPADSSAAIVDSVEVAGNHRNTTETILNAASIPLHTSIGFPAIQRAERALFALGQFDDVQVHRYSGALGEEIMVITVRERPLLVRATVRGVVKLSDRAVRERVEIPSNRPLDPALVERARFRIDSLYETEGYYLAEVRPVIVPQDSDHVRVVFDITEGRRVAIAAIRIEGNHDFRAAEIVGHMKTRPEGFWWFRRGEYSEDRLREDLEQNLPAFYGARGYVDFRVVHDTLLVDRDNGKATLVVTVDEGRSYRVGQVTVDGNRYLSTEQVMTLNPFDPSPGSGLGCLLHSCRDSTAHAFSQTAWEEATQKLKTAYANAGYIYADIRPRIDRGEAADSTGPPHVNLTWQVQEGRPAVINRVDVLGNDVTHERVIREAIVILPGDVFAQDRVLRSYQNISNLGFFQQPLPFPDTRQANDQGDIDIVFRVAEKHTGNVNFGASVGQGTGVGGFLGLDEPNLFGQGKRGHLQWQFGRNINDFDLSYTDPSLYGSRVSGTLDVHNTAIRYTIADLGRIRTRGASVQLGFPLPHSRYSRLFASYALEFESYSGASAGLSGSFRCANCLRSTAGLSFLRDTRIDLPFPTGGSTHTVSANVTGGVLGGSASFQKYDLEGRWYAPAGRLGGGAIGTGVKLVLGLTTKAGFVFGDAGPFFRQLYALGGTQYGIPLRGYDEFSITPNGFNPGAGLSGVPRGAFGHSYFTTTAEFGARFSQQIYASVFYDAGNVWSTAAGFNPTRLFRGAGVGVALITPLGPLGLDYAYGFDRTDRLGNPQPAWKFHFKIGNFF
jgi:outer membrane protein insertion porin family